MAERVSFAPEEDDDEEDSKVSSSTKSKAVSFGGSLLGRELATKQPERPAPKSFAEALNSLINKEDKEIDADKARTKPWDGPESVVAAVTEKPVAELSPDEMPLQSRDLYPHEISGGEVVLDLSHTENEPINHEAPFEDVIENEAELTEEEMPTPGEIDLELGELDDDEEAPEDKLPRIIPKRPIRAQSSQSTARSQGAGSRATPAPSGSASATVPPVPPIWHQTTQGSPGNPNQPAAANVLATPSGATTAELADAAYYAEKRGLGRGLVTGLIVGGGIEHFRHKRREKRMERARKRTEKAQQKNLEQIQGAQAIAEQNQTREAYWAAKTEARAEHATLQETEQLKNRLSTAERSAKVGENLRQAQPEKSFAAARPEASAEQLEIPEDHHVESSAWHAIEVDKHGKAVQESNIQYGHEYYRERSKEQAPKDDVHGAAGEVALVAAALSDERQSERVGQVAAQPLATSSTNEKDSDAANTDRTDIKQAIMQMAGPPQTALGTLIWFSLLVVLVVVGIVLIS